MADGGSPILAMRALNKVRKKLVADLFCGAGGLSTGADRAFRKLGVAMKLVGVNHWPVAIETNRRNHQEHAQRIHCADLESARPLQLVPEGYLDLLMAAPACTFHSRARGGKPVNDQQRMDPWHVVRWCTELRVKRLLVENVPEFMDWGPCSLVTGRPIKSRKGEYFRAWLDALRAIGMKVDYRVLCTADYGDATTRKRFFLIGCSDGRPLRWPEPKFASQPSADLLGTRRRWRAAAEIIDWNRSGSSIFQRKKPLAPNTIRRILAGAQRYGWPQPYVDALQALLDGRDPVLATASGGAAREVSQPVPTIVGGNGARPQLIEPFVFRANQGDGRNGSQRPVSEPLPTATCSESMAMAQPLVVPLSNSSSAGVPRSTDEPIRTITTAKGGDQAVAVPLIVNRCNSDGGRTARPTSEPMPTACTAGAGYLAQPLVAPYYGGGSGLTATSTEQPLPATTTKARFGLAEPVLMRAAHGDSDGRDPAIRVLDSDSPIPALTGSNEFALAEPFLVPNFGESNGQAPRTHSVAAPLPAVTATGHIQLAEPVVAGVRIDIHYRMLHWRELSRATSFDRGSEIYDFAGNATEITKQIGNAVPCETGEALVDSLMRDAT